MHILVVNDDGPPNDTCSPYILSFVRSLRQSQHTVTVVIPSVAQSWISKAHLVGKSLKSSRLHPNPSPEDDDIDWHVVDGTPASCTQLGLYYLTSRPVDLVVSGPNWGRNVTTLYNLASGTVGGALEGAQCGKKALAISFASKDKEPAEVIEAACRVATRLVSHFSKSWAPGVELYAINVPMIPEIDRHRAIYTTSLPCHWTRSSLFQEVDEKGTQQVEIAKDVREFKWRPHLKDVEHGIANAPPGTDGSAMVDENVSVTPMIATFKSPDLFLGDVFERA